MDRETVAANLPKTLSRWGLTRERVQQHYRDVPGEYLEGRFQVFLSAGKSGRLALFLYDRRMWCQYLASFLRAFRLAGLELRETDRILFVGSSDPAHTLPRVAAAFPARCSRVVGMQESLERSVQSAIDFDPTLIVGYSSALRMLAPATATGETSLRPRGVLAGTDALLPEDRRLLEDAWNVIPRLFYSTTEAGMLASECIAGRLHLYHDLVDCQIEGKELLMSQRINSAQRLERYRLPGRFAFGGSCPCRPGPTLRLLDRGRIVYPFAIHDQEGTKRWIHPIVLRSALDPLGVSLTRPPQAHGGRLMLEIEGGTNSTEEIRLFLQRCLDRAGVVLDPSCIQLQRATS